MGGKWSILRSSSCVPLDCNQYYFEAKVEQYTRGKVCFGLTSKSPEINHDDPLIEPYNLGIEYWHGIYTIQHGIRKKAECVSKLKDKDVFGVFIKYVWLKGTKIIMMQGTLNGVEVGKPLFHDNFEAYPSIGMNFPGNIVKCDLMQNEFKYQKPKGNLKYDH